MHHFNLLSLCINECTLNVAKIRSRNEEIEHIILFGIYASIIDIAKSIESIFKHGAASSTPILLRSMLEAYIEFKLIINEKNYTDYIISRHYIEWSKRGEAAQQGNIFMGKIKEKEDFLSQLSNFQARSKQAKSLNIKKMTIREKFEKLDLLDVYKSVYAVLNDDTHHNFSSLWRRYKKTPTEVRPLICWKIQIQEKLKFTLRQCQDFL